MTDLQCSIYIRAQITRILCFISKNHFLKTMSKLSIFQYWVLIYFQFFIHLFFAEKRFLLIFYLFIHFFDWYKWVTVEVAVKTTNEGKLYLKNLLLAVG